MAKSGVSASAALSADGFPNFYNFPRDDTQGEELARIFIRTPLSSGEGMRIHLSIRINTQFQMNIVGR